MSMLREWSVRKRAPTTALDLAGLDHPLLAQLVLNRDHATAAAATAFLVPAHDAMPTGPCLADLPRAVDRVARAIDRAERVIVYGDYDADGLSGATLLGIALRAAGADACVFIPHRDRDGYGLNAAQLERLAGEGVGLVVTVDCGVSGVTEVDAATAVGLDVVVTDHHEPPTILPAAFAIVNPRRADCPFEFKQLAGAGVALAVALAIVERFVAEPQRPGLVDRLYELAALGTVADIMPLVGPNRAIVRRGLAVMNARPSPGIRALLERAGVGPGEVTAETIGFKLAPRLNAPGRIAEAMLSHELLAADTRDEADALAERIEAVNGTRRTLLDEHIGRARAAVAELGPELPAALVLCGDYNSGLLGLLAARLAEEAGRPVAVLNEADVCRGSVRGIPGFDTIAAVRACHDLLDRYGGHHGAAGLSVARARLADFESTFVAASEAGMRGLLAPPPPVADARLKPETITWQLTDLLARLEPCGAGNVAPLFETRGLYVEDARVVGAKHVKLTLTAPQARLSGIAFNAADDGPPNGQHIDVLHRVRRNVWKDRRSAELEVIGWRLA